MALPPERARALGGFDCGAPHWRRQALADVRVPHFPSVRIGQVGYNTGSRNVLCGEARQLYQVEGLA